MCACVSGPGTVSVVIVSGPGTVCVRVVLCGGGLTLWRCCAVVCVCACVWSDRHCSGFPVPKWRLPPCEPRLGRPSKQEERQRTYSSHAWNLHNLPHSHGSLLSYLPAEPQLAGAGREGGK